MKKNTNLQNIINLDNNYYMQLIDDINKLPQNVTDIKNLKIKKILKNGIFLFKIDFNSLNKRQYKRLLKKTLLVKKIISRTKTEIGQPNELKILLGYIINYDKKNKEHNDFILAINAIFYPTKYKRYNYIYDNVCNYLDSYFYKKNLCDFKDNKCGEKRGTSSVTGCCHHFKYKKLG